jgi:hypothetical protein
VDSPGNKIVVLRSGVLIYAKLREANYGVWGWPQEINQVIFHERDKKSCLFGEMYCLGM